jgi:hypothetical protein
MHLRRNRLSDAAFLVLKSMPGIAADHTTGLMLGQRANRIEAAVKELGKRHPAARASSLAAGLGLQTLRQALGARMAQRAGQQQHCSQRQRHNTDNQRPITRIVGVA